MRRLALALLIGCALWALLTLATLILTDGCDVGYLMPWFDTQYSNCGGAQ